MIEFEVPEEENLEVVELSRNLSARRVFRKFLEVAAIYRPGMAVAASTEAIPPRRGVGCTVRVEPSQVEPKQYIVIVEIETSSMAETSPATLVLCDTEDHCHRFALPPAHRGVIQFEHFAAQACHCSAQASASGASRLAPLVQAFHNFFVGLDTHSMAVKSVIAKVDHILASPAFADAFVTHIGSGTIQFY